MRFRLNIAKSVKFLAVFWQTQGLKGHFQPNRRKIEGGTMVRPPRKVAQIRKIQIAFGDRKKFAFSQG